MALEWRRAVRVQITDLFSLNDLSQGLMFLI